jgi:hypothetical protein
MLRATINTAVDAVTATNAAAATAIAANARLHQRQLLMLVLVRTRVMIVLCKLILQLQVNPVKYCYLCIYISTYLYVSVHRNDEGVHAAVRLVAVLCMY